MPKIKIEISSNYKELKKVSKGIRKARKELKKLSKEVEKSKKVSNRVLYACAISSAINIRNLSRSFASKSACLDCNRYGFARRPDCLKRS